MKIIKKVLIYVRDRQALKQNLLRQEHNHQQIAKILEDFK